MSEPIRARRVSNRGEVAILQTRVPTQVLDYIRSIAMREFGSMTNFFNHWVPIYLQEQPWGKGLNWRYSKSGRSQRKIGVDANGKQILQFTDTSWVLLNASVQKEIRESVDRFLESLDVSMSTFFYTFIYWICAYIYPPAPSAKGGV
jgi:hypothetical protein